MAKNNTHILNFNAMDPADREKVAAMCRRHSDDYIARYTGFSVRQIATVRRNLYGTNEEKGFNMRKAEDWTPIDDAAERREEANAIRASTLKLQAALRDMQIRQLAA